MLERAVTKYILSVIALLLVTALVVIAPYGYSYVNDNIKEGQTHNDGTFSYSAGKSDLTYEEMVLLFESDPIWINQNPGTVNAEMYEEIYSALESLNSAMEGNEYLKEITAYPFSVNDMKLLYCTVSKVSGVVDDEPMAVNLMTVDFYSESDSSVLDVRFMYNRDNLKVYEYICNFNVYDSGESTVYEKIPLENDIATLADSQFAEYLGAESQNFIGNIYYDVESFSIFAFDGAYIDNSLSYGIKDNMDLY